MRFCNRRAVDNGDRDRIRNRPFVALGRDSVSSGFSRGDFNRAVPGHTPDALVDANLLGMAGSPCEDAGLTPLDYLGIARNIDLNRGPGLIFSDLYGD